MKIEPCPYCGGSDENIGRTSESVVRFWVHCRTCYCDGPAKETVEQATDTHNRLSRIVRAAEDWVREEKIPGNLSKIQDAEAALRNAVEGGAE